ncbi:hypothetical protein HK097_005952, partial [Rhizophlyctis rosea]
GEERILKEPLAQGRRTWSAVLDRLKEVWGLKNWHFHYLDGNKRRIDVIDELSWQLCCHDLGRMQENARVLHAVQKGVKRERGNPGAVGPAVSQIREVVQTRATSVVLKQPAASVSPGGSSTASSSASSGATRGPRAPPQTRPGPSAPIQTKPPPELFIYIEDEDDEKDEEPLTRPVKRQARESLSQSAQQQGDAREKWQSDVDKHGYLHAWENLPLESKKKFFRARGAARTIFGNPAYLLNPYEVACPLCNRVLRMSNPSNPSFSPLFSHFTSHRTDVKHIRAREMLEKRKELLMLNRSVNAKSAPLPEGLHPAPVLGSGKCLDVRYVAEGDV